MRTAEEITMRCKLILNQPDVVLLVEKSSSPTAAYDMVMDATGNDETAKAARWLGVLRRDYPDYYTEITHNILCHVPRNTARKGEKERKMSKYTLLVAKSGQVNTPPGSYVTVKEWVANSFIGPHSNVLEIGCSTGFIAIELARYTGAKTIGIDSNAESIATAQQNVNVELAGRCSFLTGDAGRLPFPERQFLHVVVGGHLPFIPHQLRQPHVMEAIRVLQPWGFLLTALYFYHTTPPTELLEQFNAEVDTHLRPEYNQDYWSSLFEHPELELEHESVYAFSLPDEARIQQYVEQINPETHRQWDHRLRLFAENGRYLHFFVRVYRRYPTGATLRQIPRGGIYTNFHLIERRER